MSKLGTVGIALAMMFLFLPAGPADAEVATNSWSCRPTAAHPEPVVLVHGTSDNRDIWSTLAPQLSSAGYCVFALTYGVLPGSPGPLSVYGGIDSMRRSATELADFIARIRSATGAAKVDIVGHSQGSIMPEYYLKFLGGKNSIAKYVALAPLWDGTTKRLAPGEFIGTPLEVPASEVVNALCAACRELMHGSEFLNTLRANGVLSPVVEYTNIMTAADEVVVPYTSGYVLAPNATNIVIQHDCVGGPISHLGLLSNSTAAQHVLNSLDPVHQRPVVCDS